MSALLAHNKLQEKSNEVAAQGLQLEALKTELLCCDDDERPALLAQLKALRASAKAASAPPTQSNAHETTAGPSRDAASENPENPPAP
mmetsp:Transcript_13848/g.39214  ORF Transcript_13848/g.39214 Transcript_13848/m.39214 type:complete len:88 (-) Transcript_13848:73-336(-)